MKIFTFFIAFSIVFHIFILCTPLPKSLEKQNLKEDQLFVLDLEKLNFHDNAKKQIVDTEQGRISKKPVKTRFLGQRSQSVQKQTRAKNHGETFLLGSFSRNTLFKEETDKEFIKKPSPSKRLTRGSQTTRDYLKDVEYGDKTLLNTSEFIYYSYYNRIKLQLQGWWTRKVRRKMLRMIRKGRFIASNMDHITTLVVVLDDKGMITRILVKESSNMMELDEAAVEAFRQAGPFPHPPDGIANNDGEIVIEWSFVVET